MSNIDDILKVERLFDVAWDGNKLREIFTQIIKIFNTHEEGIKEISENLKNFVTKDAFSKLNEECGELGERIRKDESENKLMLQNEVDKINKNLEKIKMIVNDTNLETMTESKRIIETETNELKESIEQTNIAGNETAGKIASIETEIRLMKTNIEKVNLELSIQKQATRQMIREKSEENMLGSVLHSEEDSDDGITESINNLFTRLDGMDNQLDKITELDNKITGITLNIPMIKSLLEKKIDDLNVSLLNLGQEVDTAKSAISHQQQMIPTYIPPKFVTPTIQKEEAKVKKPETVEEKPELEEPKEETPVNTLPAKERVTFDPVPLNKETVPEGFQGVTPYNKVVDDGNEEELDKRILQVFENKIYTTQMQSSMRTITEIEAIKKSLAQHHQSLHKIQVQQNVTKENIQSIMQNLTTVNTAHLEKISLLQQNLQQSKRAIDEIKKTSSDNVTNLKKRITSVTGYIQDLRDSFTKSLSEIRQEPVKVEEKEEEQEPATNTNTNPLNSHPVLPPLPNLNDKNSKFYAYNLDDDDDDQYEEDRYEEEEEEEEVVKKPFHLQSRTSYQETNTHKLLQDLTIEHFVEDLPPMPEFVSQVCHMVTPGTETSRQVYDEELSDSLYSSPIEEIESPPPVEEKKEVVESAKSSLKSFRSFNSSRINNGPTRMIMKYMVPIQRKRPSTAQETENVPMITDQQIENRVSKAVSVSVKSYQDRITKEVDDKITQFQGNVDRVLSALDRKIDRDFVERVFDKFRTMLNQFNEQMENMQASFLNWVTRDELEIVLKQFNNIISSEDNTAVSTSKYTCLLCGRPKRGVAGMINEQSLHNTRKSLNAKASMIRPTIKSNSVLSDNISVMSV